MVVRGKHRQWPKRGGDRERKRERDESGWVMSPPTLCLRTDSCVPVNFFRCLRFHIRRMVFNLQSYGLQMCIISWLFCINELMINQNRFKHKIFVESNPHPIFNSTICYINFKIESERQLNCFDSISNPIKLKVELNKLKIILKIFSPIPIFIKKILRLYLINIKLK